MAPFVVVRRGAAADAAVAERIIAAALAEHGIAFEREGRDADVAAFGARADHDDLVAEDPRSGAAIGVVSVGPHGDPGVAWISKLFVARDARRRGVGRALMDAAHAAARARGYRVVGLRTRDVFGDAVRLYERLGYVRKPSAGGDPIFYRPLA